MEPRVLFLHGGPGLTAELERRLFGASLPVHWWDQPHVRCGTKKPFESLVDAAVAEVERLSYRPSLRIDLLGSCFGSLLARALVDRIPERIASVTISGGILDVRAGILRLGNLLAKGQRDLELEALCRETAARDSAELYFALLVRVSTMPAFLDCHWSSEAQALRNAMRALAASGRLIDWPTLQSVMTATLTSYQAFPVTLAFPGEVRILLGRYDPYFDESDVAGWTTLWPSATVEIVNAGHFPHLELPSRTWMPRRSS